MTDQEADDIAANMEEAAHCKPKLAVHEYDMDLKDLLRAIAQGEQAQILYGLNWVDVYPIEALGRVSLMLDFYPQLSVSTKVRINPNNP